MMNLVLTVLSIVSITFAFRINYFPLRYQYSVYETLQSVLPRTFKLMPLRVAKIQKYTAVDTLHDMKGLILSNRNETAEMIMFPKNADLSLMIFGEPLALGRHRSTKLGRMYNPSKKMQSRFAEACQSLLPEVPFEGPLEVSLAFYFTRPKHHYRTGKYSHILKDDAARWHTKRGGAF